jgi:hypothetical protein
LKPVTFVAAAPLLSVQFLEGTNSTELLYDAHAKSPAHIYDAEQPQQQDHQQQQQQQQHSAQLQRDDSNRQRDQQQQQQQDEPMPDIPEPVQQQDQQQQQQQQEQKTPARQEPSSVIERGSSSPELQQQQQQRQQQPSPALLQSVQDADNAPQQQQQQQSPQLPAIATQQQQQQQVGSPAPGESPVSGRQQSNSPGPSSGSGGDMKPPSLVDMARRVLGRRPELFGPIDGAYGPGLAGSGGPGRLGSRLGPLRRSQSGNAAATAAASGGLPPTPPLRTGSHDVSMATGSMHTASMHTASSHDGTEGAAAGSSLQSEPSLNMGQQLHRQLSSAASLENWLGPGSRTASGSPRSMSAAAERQLLMRTGSNMSTGSGQGSVGRQNSLVLGQQGGLSRGSSLDKQASFAGWPELAPGVAAAAAAAGGGSFSWPAPAPMRTISEDSLKLDIQVRVWGLGTLLLLNRYNEVHCKTGDHVKPVTRAFQSFLDQAIPLMTL